jgi:hypothetical protein
MNSFIDKDPNPSVVQSVSELVAEGGNVLASDDAPIVPGQTFLETSMLANTRRATSRIRVGQSPLLSPHKILLRASGQRRPTLHLPSFQAMTEESKSGEEPLPCKVSYRPRGRMTLGRVRLAIGSS